MGTYYVVQEIDFKIPAEYVPAAIAMLREKVRQWADNYQKEYPATLEGLLEEQDGSAFLQAVAELECWHTTIAEDGIVNPGIGDRVKGGINIDWMDAMFPFVASGSYVQIHCEDGDRVWRHVWKDGKRERIVYPVWPEPDENEEEE